MGACGGRECGGGPELPAAGKAVFDKWAAGPGKDSPAAKDSDALTAWAILYRKLTIHPYSEAADPAYVVHSVNRLDVVGPAGSHYHFDVDHTHKELNSGNSRSVKWGVMRDAKGNWQHGAPCPCTPPKPDASAH